MFFYKVSMTHGYTQLCQGRGDLGIDISVCPFPQPTLTLVRVDSFFLKNYLFIWLYLVLFGTPAHTNWGIWTLSSSLWDLVPWPGIEPRPPALGAWSLSHWTTGEVSGWIAFYSLFLCPDLSFSFDSLVCMANEAHKLNQQISKFPFIWHYTGHVTYCGLKEVQSSHMNRSIKSHRVYSQRENTHITTTHFKKQNTCWYPRNSSCDPRSHSVQFSRSVVSDSLWPHGP